MEMDEIYAKRLGRMRRSEIREVLKILGRPDVISFAGGIPDPDLFPKAEFQKAFSEILGSQQADIALQYSVSEGYEPLRRWIAEHMTKLGVPCSFENILITSGSQQALDYLGKLFLSPDDTALVSWPTYLGALQAFGAYEPNFDQLNLHGNRVAADYQQSAQSCGGKVKFIYSSVDFANPTGETLDLQSRTALLDLAEDLNSAVVEDAAYQSLRYEGEAVPPLLALDIKRSGNIESTRTIYCGSFSKSLSPGLRVGWVCASKSFIEKLLFIKQASDLHTPTINQMAIHQVVEENFDDQVAKLKRAYIEKRNVMLQALEEYMPDGVSWNKPEGGMFVWVTLPAEIDGKRLFEQALRDYKIAFVPGQAFFPDGTGTNTLRLNFSRPDHEQIKTGIERLGAAIANYT